MSANECVDLKNELEPRLRLSVEALNLLDTYLNELVREENLSHGAQVLLRRVAAPVCALCNDVDAIFVDHGHPARKILDTTIQIAKLSGDRFMPNEALYQTVMESIKTLRSKNINRYDTLRRVQGDLESVLRLALIRAPATSREEAAHAGRISAAKISAALMIVGHAQRFDANDEVLQFCLTQWFEFVVVTILQCGTESSTYKEVDRLTFTVFYLNSGRSGDKRGVFLNYLLPTLDELVASFAPTCMGHTADFRALRQNLSSHIAVK